MAWYRLRLIRHPWKGVQISRIPFLPLFMWFISAMLHHWRHLEIGSILATMLSSNLQNTLDAMFLTFPRKLQHVLGYGKILICVICLQTEALEKSNRHERRCRDSALGFNLASLKQEVNPVRHMYAVCTGTWRPKTRTWKQHCGALLDLRKAGPVWQTQENRYELLWISISLSATTAQATRN